MLLQLKSDAMQYMHSAGKAASKKNRAKRRKRTMLFDMLSPHHWRPKSSEHQAISPWHKNQQRFVPFRPSSCQSTVSARTMYYSWQGNTMKTTRKPWATRQSLTTWSVKNPINPWYKLHSAIEQSNHSYPAFTWPCVSSNTILSKSTSAEIATVSTIVCPVGISQSRLVLCIPTRHPQQAFLIRLLYVPWSKQSRDSMRSSHVPTHYPQWCTTVHPDENTFDDRTIPLLSVGSELYQ